MPYIICADIESFIRKIDGCANNPVKISQHIPCGYSMSKTWGSDDIENKHALYCWKDFMKKFCSSLRKQEKNIFDFEKKKCRR